MKTFFMFIQSVQWTSTFSLVLLVWSIFLNKFVSMQYDSLHIPVHTRLFEVAEIIPLCLTSYDTLKYVI